MIKLRELDPSDIISREFSQEMLQRVITAYRFWFIGVIVTCKERLINKFGSDDFNKEIWPRLVDLAFEQKAVILDVCTDDFNDVDTKIKQLRNSLVSISEFRLTELKEALIKP